MWVQLYLMTRGHVTTVGLTYRRITSFHLPVTLVNYRVILVVTV